jgi:hypothetical protein
MTYSQGSTAHCCHYVYMLGSKPDDEQTNPWAVRVPAGPHAGSPSASRPVCGQSGYWHQYAGSLTTSRLVCGQSESQQTGMHAV